VYQGKIPFTIDGRQCTYASKSDIGKDTDYVKWRDNYEFDANLLLEKYQTGQSAINFIFKNLDNGEVYESGISEFFAMTAKMVNRKIRGRFCFGKYGQNYLLTALELYDSYERSE
jgi:hypothetical protein